MRTILVADDNPISRELIRETLETRDFTVIEACDGKDALEKIQETNPDAVLMDIQMPAMDGFAVLRAVRSEPRFAALPVLALTAFAMQGDREKALAAGFDGYITKPIDIMLLREEVEQLLS